MKLFLLILTFCHVAFAGVPPLQKIETGRYMYERGYYFDGRWVLRPHNVAYIIVQGRSLTADSRYNCNEAGTHCVEINPAKPQCGVDSYTLVNSTMIQYTDSCGSYHFYSYLGP